MTRYFSLLGPFSALSFSIVSLVFTFLALTSREWAVRDNYDKTLNPPEWGTPLYTLYRSPFIVCGYDDVINNSTNPQDHVICFHFKPYGFDQTSCETVAATQDDTAPSVGDARFCQQIHLAGNFAIASSCFISLGFILTALLAFATLPPLGLRAGREVEGELVRAEGERERKHHHPPRGERGYRRSHVVPVLNLALVIFLIIAAICALISQFYGIIGLIQSQPNQSDYASSQGNQDPIPVIDPDPNWVTHGNHGPWYQGNALSVYETVAWGFALATAAIAGNFWRLPRWEY